MGSQPQSSDAGLGRCRPTTQLWWETWQLGVCQASPSAIWLGSASAPSSLSSSAEAQPGSQLTPTAGLAGRRPSRNALVTRTHGAGRVGTSRVGAGWQGLWRKPCIPPAIQSCARTPGHTALASGCAHQLISASTSLSSALQRRKQPCFRRELCCVTRLRPLSRSCWQRRLASPGAHCPGSSNHDHEQWGGKSWW